MNLVKYIGMQFAKPTGFFGGISTFLMNHMNQVQYNSVIKNIKKINQGNILDIGFGNGYLLSRLAVGTEAKYYGIEISKDMLEAAEKRNAEYIEAGKMYLKLGNVLAMDYENNFFKAIYTVNTIYFWNNLEDGFTEIFRTLEPGGIFVNAFYAKEWLDKLRYTKYNFCKYHPSELEKAAKNVGFSKIQLYETKKNTSYCMIITK